jgi:ABC-type lipoprotein export system ATPase subunit
MNEPIKYIAKVEIKNLWGRYDIEWNLDPSVNVLSGINGSGKSTVLNCIGLIIGTNVLVEEFLEKVDLVTITLNNNKIFTSNGREIMSNKKLRVNQVNIEVFKSLNLDFINTFDQPLNQNASPNEKVKTKLDKDIFNLQKKYLDYQLNIGKKAFEIVSKNGKNTNEEVLKVKKQHNRFLEIIDLLFADTDKKVDRENNELMFLSGKDKLTPYQLSSGEKQMIIILLTVLVQDNKPSILFMDEPEISLHLDWQRKLIQYIKELNPNVQIILATHSPGIILEGWSDKVSEMSDLITLDRQAKLENAK